MTCLDYLKILSLAEYPDWLAPLVAQQWQEWGYDAPDELADFFAQEFTVGWPKTWLLIDTGQQNERLVGAVTLSQNELGEMQDSTRNPWLGYLLIDTPYRGQGYAKLLTRYAVQEGHKLGYQQIYLYASDEMPRYLHWGWQPVERLFFQEEWVTVMVSPPDW